jgi:6-phosphofructokinase 1
MGTNALLNGENDKMVTLVRHMTPTYQCTTGFVELAKVADAQRLMPGEYLNESKTMVTPLFYDYALPLLGEPLPHHAHLEMKRVNKP